MARVEFKSMHRTELFPGLLGHDLSKLNQAVLCKLDRH